MDIHIIVNAMVYIYHISKILVHQQVWESCNIVFSYLSISSCILE